MDVNELKADAAAGKISVERLIDAIVVQQKRIEQLEAQIKRKNPTDRLDQAYSEMAEEKRSNERSRRPPLRRGRITTADKIKLSQRTEQVFPENVALQDCQLSHVVHCDETSWSINSVWAFLNDKLTVLFYGVHKDGETLAQNLNKKMFAGVLVSDNAAVYRKAKRVAADGRLGDHGREQRVALLDDATTRKTGRTNKIPQAQHVKVLYRAFFKVSVNSSVISRWSL